MGRGGNRAQFETFLVFPQRRLALYRLLGVGHFGTLCVPLLRLILQQIYEVFVITILQRRFLQNEVTITDNGVLELEAGFDPSPVGSRTH